MKKPTLEKGESSTRISSCSCSHSWQDKTYGKGKRLFNAKGDKNKCEYKCTVCEKIKTL